MRARRQAIRKFIAWADERGLADPREITKPMLERYQRHLFYYRKPDGSRNEGAPLHAASALLMPRRRQKHVLAMASPSPQRTISALRALPSGEGQIKLFLQREYNWAVGAWCVFLIVFAYMANSLA